ncbi:spore germination protein GerPE [Paenibacillus cremeus]|uniref:Spore germination protein GerPE n=1 Tax=Paenibacillus cremeus TaxID=2163881 RepID=A0A559KBM4_9BACL|nr:spore germination protein GerPE [Paenibacillus cremeus]TVY09535.1 spore germination protein GerPE [Paenibacillus cremeus]
MRISVIDQVKVEDVTICSTLFVGDMKSFTPETRALAVQREIPTYNGNEGNLSQFSLFQAVLPRPSNQNPVHADIVNENPYIRVGAVKVLSVSTCSLYQMGSNVYIDCEARIKHIRQLLHGERPVKKK